LRPRVRPHNASQKCSWIRETCQAMHLPGDRGENALKEEVEPLASSVDKH